MRFVIIVVLCLCCSSKIECSLNKDLSTCFTDDCQFKSKKLIKVSSIDSAGFKIAENYTGIAQSYFYAISASNKSQTATIYNKDIGSQILLIHQDIKSLSKYSTEPADLVSNTLTQLTIAVNQLIIDSSVNASENILQTDYAQIQAIVDFFKKKFPHTLSHDHKKSVRKAVNLADQFLQAFANHIEIYIRQLNALVFESSFGNQQLVLSQNELVLNLRKFVVASALAAYLSTD